MRHLVTARVCAQKMPVKLLSLKPFDLKQTATISREGCCHGRDRVEDWKNNLGENENTVREKKGSRKQ